MKTIVPKNKIMETLNIEEKREFIINYHVDRKNKMYEKAKNANTVRLHNIYIGMAKNHTEKANFIFNAWDSYIEKYYRNLTEENN